MGEKKSKVKDTALKNRKKITICAIIVAAVVLIAVLAGVGLHKYRTVEPYKLQSIQFTDESLNKNVKLIAHRGARASAPENALPAYNIAGQAGYWGAECDIYRTKDGVWVLQHNKTTYRLMNKKKTIENSTYGELKSLYYVRGNNINSYYQLRICTLDEYLQSCAQYQMTPIVELKGNHNTEHYDEIVNAAKKSNTNPIYIAFDKEDLVAMRKLTDAKMFLLTDELSDETIKDAKSIKNCGIEFSAAKDKNFKNNGELITRAQKQGLETAAWGVNDIETMQKLVKLNTYYLTTDSLSY